MSIRMVTLSTTFPKMHRIARDMSKKLGKEVRLELIGEETEVDKNIIEHISDPLMHIVRNSIDHGMESAEDRTARGKAQIGIITLEAQNSGSDVIVTIKDDGKGLNRENILLNSVAKEAGPNAVGVILTGMGYDGAKGLLTMRRKGARTIGQDEQSSVVYGMPKVAFDIGAVEKQASLSSIPQVLMTMLR